MPLPVTIVPMHDLADIESSHERLHRPASLKVIDDLAAVASTPAASCRRTSSPAFSMPFYAARSRAWPVTTATGSTRRRNLYRHAPDEAGGGEPAVALPVAAVAEAPSAPTTPHRAGLLAVRLPESCPGGTVHLLPVGDGRQFVRPGQAVTADHVIAPVEYTDSVGNRMLDEIVAGVACMIRRVCVEHLHQVGPAEALLEVEALDSASPSANRQASPAVSA